MKICENCKSEHDGTYGSGRFCSRSCANNRGPRSEKTKRKIGKTLKNKIKKGEEIGCINSNKIRKNARQNIKKICLTCKREFETKIKKQKFCSRLCSGKVTGGWKLYHNNISKEKWSEINKKAYQNGNNYVAGGTTKWYNYKDIKVQGTYELRTCKILDKWKEKRKIKDWEYTNERIEYIGVDEKKHSYLLDFKVITNENFEYYIEVKGYETSNDMLKWKTARKKGYKLEIWFEKDIIRLEKIKIL